MSGKRHCLTAPDETIRPELRGNQAMAPVENYKRDFPTALRAVRKLLADGNDTTQVFVIMRALNGGVAKKNYTRLLGTPAGARLAYRRVELAERFSDPAFVASFAPGTVGAAYRSFLESTGYSAAGLAEISNLNGEPLVEHPYAWFGRRMRDIHDIWHVLTGYKADDTLGEAALVAFSYAQSNGLGWAFIALAASLKSLRMTRSTVFARAVIEGWRAGRKALWLPGEDYEALLHEPLEAARARLRIGEPVAYLAAQKQLGEALKPQGKGQPEESRAAGA
jgi:ubiquinone biosynthesis protein COQ4